MVESIDGNGNSTIEDFVKAAMKKLSGVKAVKRSLSIEASASNLGIWVDSEFKPPESYEGQFNSGSVTYKI